MPGFLKKIKALFGDKTQEGSGKTQDPSVSGVQSVEGKHVDNHADGQRIQGQARQDAESVNAATVTQNGSGGASHAKEHGATQGQRDLQKAQGDPQQGQKAQAKPQDPQKRAQVAQGDPQKPAQVVQGTGAAQVSQGNVGAVEANKGQQGARDPQQGQDVQAKPQDPQQRAQGDPQKPAQVVEGRGAAQVSQGNVSAAEVKKGQQGARDPQQGQDVQAKPQDPQKRAQGDPQKPAQVVQGTGAAQVSQGNVGAVEAKKGQQAQKPQQTQVVQQGQVAPHTQSPKVVQAQPVVQKSGAQAAQSAVAPKAQQQVVNGNVGAAGVQQAAESKQAQQGQVDSQQQRNQVAPNTQAQKVVQAKPVAQKSGAQAVEPSGAAKAKPQAQQAEEAHVAKEAQTQARPRIKGFKLATAKQSQPDSKGETDPGTKAKNKDAAKDATKGESKENKALEAEATPKAPPKVPEDILRFQPDNVLQNRGKPPLGVRVTLYALATCLVLLLIWAIIGKVDRVVVGEGKIVTMAQPVILQAYSLSLVKEIRTRMGERVRKGDILVVLDPTFAQADLVRLQERVTSLVRHEERLQFELNDLIYPPKRPAPLTASDAREERIQADIWKSRHQEYAAKLETYAEQRKKLLTEMESIGADSLRRTERLKIFQELEEMRHKLYVQGIEAKAGFLDVQKDRLSVEADLLRLQASLREKKHELEGVEASRSAYITGWRSSTAQELVKVRRDLDEAREQWNKALKMGELVDIRAPMDAVVLELAKRNEGSVVSEAEALVTLVPDDAELEAEVDIMPEDIGYIKVGMPAAIKLSTLPYQRHGQIDAVIKALSHDAFDKEVPGSEPIRVFRARLSLPKDPLEHLRNLPDGFTLLPGLSLSAEISAGDRRIIEYVLFPIEAGFDAGLREPR
ncbi:MAG: HlyD family type I secretion periplasmic adaptor subunit [Desulfovibrionaceae bacterium]|nr:HlyD family type I secretion periplasmic adaptor subunit [Desulfovibrionaceae bacterium]